MHIIKNLDLDNFFTDILNVYEIRYLNEKYQF